MIITIDGPAGTGKSTVARIVARRLGYDFLDTGAMYRAIGLEAINREADLDDPRALAFVARLAKIDFDFAHEPPEVLVNGHPVGSQLRSDAVTRAASFVAVVPAIREMLVEQQRRIGQERPNLVTEGRDQGTIVFPHAELKFFLDATPEERARRRTAQLRKRGEIVDPTRIYQEMIERDRRDETRAVSPTRRAEDAVSLDTTQLEQDQVVETIVRRAEALVRRP
ncbi:MAG: (d)CMP kinase [Phycisphaerae bacterium]